MVVFLLKGVVGMLLSFVALLFIAYGILCVPNEVEEEGERSDD